MSLLLYHHVKALDSNQYQVGWAPKQVRTLWREENYLSRAKNRATISQSSSL
jgi:hypothetical protein